MGSADEHTHTHTHPFNGPFSGTTWVSKWVRKVKPIWILLKQETVSGSGISWAICKSASRSRQITMPTTQVVSADEMDEKLKSENMQKREHVYVIF